MAFDSTVLSAIIGELKQNICGARINKISQCDATTVLVRYHNIQGRGALLICAHAQNGRLHLTDNPPANPAQATLFTMVLRKWLDGARIEDIGHTDGERVAWLELDTRDELGDPRRLKLMIEIMGKHSNIILVDEQGQIIDGIRRYGSSLSRYREVLPGRPYLPPPPLNRLPLPPQNANQLGEALYAEAENSISHTLSARVRGISPLLAQDICRRAALDPQSSAEQLGVAQIELLYQQLCLLRSNLDQQRFTPTLKISGRSYSDFAAFTPLTWPDSESCPTMNQAVDKFFRCRQLEQELEAHRRAVLKQLGQHSNRLRKKISLQEGELARSEAADEYKLCGDLLAANIYHLEKGQSRVELADFEEPDQLHTIELDPALSPQENIQRCYRRYAKAKNARGLITTQLTASRDELDYLLTLEQAATDSDSEQALSEVQREATAAGYLRPSAPQRGAKHEDSAPLPPRRYTSSDGFTVLIGRNNRQNDRLSMKMAAADDIWLHTQKIPGAHVIILRQGKDIPDTTISEAATWAAWFSKAKTSSQVPVDLVNADKLVKPNGSRPGFVTYSGQRTLYVTPAEPPREEE